MKTELEKKDGFLEGGYIKGREFELLGVASPSEYKYFGDKYVHPYILDKLNSGKSISDMDEKIMNAISDSCENGSSFIMIKYHGDDVLEFENIAAKNVKINKTED